MKPTNQLLTQVIDLFKEQPKYRDDRYGTIKYIIETYHLDVYGHNGVLSDFKLLTDIDRIFRLVQQEIPELRGKEWLKRQMQSGEISKDEYEKNMQYYELIAEVRQLKLF